MAVLLTTADAIPIVNKYTALPKRIDLSANLRTLTIKYSRIRVFCKAWLMINKNAIVIYSGI